MLERWDGALYSTECEQIDETMIETFTRRKGKR